MKVGFTGSRRGMTERQTLALAHLVQSSVWSEFHHGGCIGADAQAHALVLTWKKKREVLLPAIHNHPALLPMKVIGECPEADSVYPPLEPLTRNRVIVDAVCLLVACPRGLAEEQRSGTWSTVRYARAQDVPVLILDP